MGAYEAKRLATLRQLNLLDTTPSESFDRITRMASRIFNLPIAAISLSDEDRQWFKSRVGVEHQEIPRFRACCGEVADTSGMVVVEDLLASTTYQNSVLAESGMRFYAGAPLTTRDGYTLGAMCVLGTEPRVATEEELDALRDLAAMVMAQIDLQHAVGRIDPTTTLPNYLQFVEDLEDLARDRAGSTYYTLSTELVDLSEASTLQRVMGPSYLEELSRQAGARLRENLGQATRLYHIGPCQFAHLETGDETRVLERAEALRDALLGLSIGESSPFMLQPVIGIAPFRAGETTPGSVLRTAHSASRDARDAEMPAGIYSEASDASHQRRFGLITNFGQALENDDQLHMVYQPRIALASGRCLGAEALIRWRHSSLGNVSPGEFIPLVEKTPMARALTDWVLRSAIRQAAIWHEQNRGLRISINIAASNLEESDFTARVIDYLDAEQLPCTAIELELTESGLIGNGRAAREQLKALMETGIRIAIDDFGTGYSSLAYLQKIPAHIVKIDRSFIDGLEHRERSQTLVRSLISMAHDLGYGVVAEGVETRKCHDFLASLGCDEVQGYLFAAPLTPGDFERWLKDRDAPG
ncbi:sensor domain-containing phosphodiesterase [Chromatocurvus halotolerans]|uniref:EAL domain-containing protein (Putative c-di-GMP-specific phosphodiesterase class I) n=1 Tax=Chromatocurvus halotolerans TaxID=1132028 RepID=A0A4R2KR07_9GAMM|nr:GGDEF and EAL domain-containing protein [Chromatocurvus halotolerans]TCO76084.1 EAL domain-containing protein (putative c-di-GMP-specific phosphodiesterase class I) [Chromatocurvus halotolerans]